MIIFQELYVSGFRNIKEVKLENLKDLNIFIGPNNCGKTNLLELLNYFSKLSCGKALKPLCGECAKFYENSKTECFNVSISYDDFYLKDIKRKVVIKFSFKEETINQLVPGILEKLKKELENAQCPEAGKPEIYLESSNLGLYCKHLSYFLHSDLMEEFRNWILYCPGGRLQAYKGKDFAKYIREKRLSGAEMRKLIDFIARFVDPKICDYRYEDLIRVIDDVELTVKITEQGSGVRSLICLVADILSARDFRILLIDEPELGLNPHAKHEFLKFLLELADEKQVFMVTQDPTYVNPVLWRDYESKVSVYLFSLIDEKFVKIDLQQNKEDPETFAGYLPHTASLKKIHIYVEGSSDVYVYQILLRKFLKKHYPNNWFEIENKIGIFHLCGDFWKHLLYTIPKKPYHCVVILDGDKRELAKKIISKHNKSIVNTAKFKIAEEPADIGKILNAVYCLQRDKIEDYLFPSEPPPNYNKRYDAPKAAERLEEVPKEIEEVFKALLGIGEKNDKSRRA